MKHLRTLVMMQLRDKLDMSFLRNGNRLLLKIALSVVLVAVVTVAFWGLFKICVLFSVFSFVGGLPDVVVTVLFTVMQLLSIITCTAGLTRTLYMAADNRVLLTFPVPANYVFLSKIILYYIFELKKNVAFTIPMYLAYGFVNGAVWYYYPWMLLCFVFISLLPVAIGAVLSIPGLFIAVFVSNFRWIQYILVAVAAVLFAWFFFLLINAIPDNINLIGQWGSISMAIQGFLSDFARIFLPYHLLNRMVVGGTLQISAALFSGSMFITFAVFLGVLAVLLGMAFFAARPLFFKMAVRFFEFEKAQAEPRPNKVRNKYASAFSEEMTKNFRSGGYVIKLFVQLLLPPLAVFLLNKVYGAMNTSFAGQNMTKAFNLLVLLTMLLSFNAEYASVYSKDGSARSLLKTRPVNAAVTLVARLVPRAVVSTAAAIAAAGLYAFAADPGTLEVITIACVAVCANLAHLLWSAELDIMNPRTEQYAMLGSDYNNPNDFKSTVLAVLISGIFAFLLYFLARDGFTSALIKLLVLSVVFLGVRAVLYFARVRYYFAEK